MILGIVGSRGMCSVNLIGEAVEHFKLEPTMVISGGARGADKLAILWAKARRIPYKEYLPEWDRYGKGAGMIRNSWIVEDVDAILALWDGHSKGTEDTIKKAKKAGKPVYIYYYDEMSMPVPPLLDMEGL